MPTAIGRVWRAAAVVNKLRAPRGREVQLRNYAPGGAAFLDRGSPAIGGPMAGSQGSARSLLQPGVALLASHR